MKLTKTRDNTTPPSTHTNAIYSRHALPQAIPEAGVGLTGREDLYDAFVVRCLALSIPDCEGRGETWTKKSNAEMMMPNKLT